MASQIPISVRRDHLEQLAFSARPVDALCELIWNAFDADATRVDVSFSLNLLGGVEEITVQDNGTGIFRGHAEVLFGHLGESWKREKRHSSGGRMLHGCKGRGRFKAFGLGNTAVWQTICHASDGMGLSEYSIRGDMAGMEGFLLDDPKSIHVGATGTTLRISGLYKDCGSLLGERGRLSLAEIFGPYLSRYPGIALILDGQAVDPGLVQLFSEEDNLVVPLENGAATTALVRIVEWKQPAERFIHLCDESGFVLHSVRPGPSIRAKGCEFTAYVRSPAIAPLSRENRLDLDELDPVVSALVDACRERLRHFLLDRDDAKGIDVVKSWIHQGLHPLPDTDKSPLGEARRELFDQAALQVARRWPGFAEAGDSERRLLFGLVFNAVESTPVRLVPLLEESIGLDKRHRERLQRLADKTQGLLSQGASANG